VRLFGFAENPWVAANSAVSQAPFFLPPGQGGAEQPRRGPRAGDLVPDVSLGYAW
jgi:hypothetical protein